MRPRSGPRPHKEVLMAQETEWPYVSPEAAGRLLLCLGITLEDAVGTQHSPLGASSWGRLSSSISVLTVGCPELLWQGPRVSDRVN